MHSADGHIAATFGLVLATALIAGLLADQVRLPKVVAYLLVGILLGPAVLDLLATSHVHALHPLTQMAMALVLFGLGCHFPMRHVRRIMGKVFRLSFGELGVTFLLVGVGMLLIGESWATAVLLASLALATAPATTVLMLKEMQSEGPVTEYTGALVVVNNLVSILAFELTFLAIHLAHGQSAVPLSGQVVVLLQDLVGSLALGVVAGLVVSYGCGILAPNWWLVLLVAATSSLLGLDEILVVPYMISFLAMGITVANTSDAADQIVRQLDGLTGFLCVVFFVIHGAELDLEAFGQVGLIGVVYIVCRCAGKYVGARSAARWAREAPAVRRWLGTSILAQAGAAIALSSILVQRDPALGRPIQAVILGTVVFFEIAGPLLIRHSIMRAGEVPLVQAVHHSAGTPLSELQALVTRLLVALGFDPTRRRDPGQLTVMDLTRKNVQPLLESADFDEVVSLIEHSHDNTYAVVDQDGLVTGVIRYADLSHVLFDRQVAGLVRAADLAVPPRQLLYADQQATAALQLFRTSRDDCIPVVEAEEPHRFVGVVRRRDVVGYLLRRDDDRRAGSGH